ncbi:uncharacterized protein [Apostichopus japonicus]|uniref:uncharacterized protein n=1 Tax=Stichopus japonicus TaxID=307972 RepID=UPI003AB63E74
MDIRNTVLVVCLCTLEGAHCLSLGFGLDFNIRNTDFNIKGERFNCTGRPNQFPCFDEDDSCIFMFFFCDTIIDCPNGFDENPFFCSNAWQERCRLEEAEQTKPFDLAYCENGMCITECDVCDGNYLDCTDGSDEDPELCNSDSRPTIQGDCSHYWEGFDFP